MPAYNNYFPVTYPQMSYQAPYQQPVQYSQPVSQSSSSNAIQWVQGEAGAKAYPVQSGTSVLLMDSESECFYIKSSDPSGMPMPLRRFTYKEVIDSPTVEKSETSFNPQDYVTKEDFNSLKRQIENMKSRKDKGNE